nr:MAG TPA: hypothetical protein [Caudoviricetes sp.]
MAIGAVSVFGWLTVDSIASTVSETENPII